MKTFNRSVVGGAFVGLALLATTSTPLFAQTHPTTPGEDGAHGHEQMHQMMDAMHGEGASERMHQAMGPDAERMMDQCAGMMGMMQGGRGMMGR